MNWEAIGATGEVTGAIGVIATIGYLAVQVRRNTQSLDAAIDNTYVEYSLRWTDTFSSLESSRILLKGFTEPTSLSDAESVQFGSLLVRFVMFIDCVQSMRSHGALSDERWDVAQLDIVAFLGTKGGCMWWKANRKGFTKSTAQIIDETLEKDDEPAFQLADWRHE
jgi:hypothetical protein